MTPQIDILKATPKKDGSFVVDYWDENIEDSMYIMTVSEDELIGHIIDNDMNVEHFTNWSFRSLECDGLDERIINPYDYLQENKDEVILDYVKANHTKQLQSC